MMKTVKQKATLLLALLLCVTTFPMQALAHTADKDLLLQKVEDVVLPGQITYASLYSIDEVAKADLKAAGEAAVQRGGKVFFSFCTLSNDEQVKARLIVNPHLLPDTEGVINPMLYLDSAEAAKVKKQFEKHFGRSVAVIHCMQQDYGMNVVVSAKLDLTGLDPDNLVAYSYNQETNLYHWVKNAGCAVGDNGFTHLQTSQGGFLVITNLA